MCAILLWGRAEAWELMELEEGGLAFPTDTASLKNSAPSYA